jgi:hypothetical protein
MRHIAYAEAVFATDEHLGDLLLQYATVLARAGSADTVIVPGRIAGGGGGIEPVSILVGPASQMTAWSDGDPFGADVSAEVADLEQRIRAATSSIATSDGPDGPDGFDAYGELD